MSDRQQLSTRTIQQTTPDRIHTVPSPTLIPSESRVAIPSRQDSLNGPKSARTSQPDISQLRNFGYVPEIKSIGEARVVIVGDAEHLETKAEVVTVEHLLTPSYAVVSPGVEVPEAIGGLVGEIGTASPLSSPIRSPFQSEKSPTQSSDERVDSPLKSVKFGTPPQEAPLPARVVKFQDETDVSDARSSSPTPMPHRSGEQKSILKVRTGPNAIDEAALMAVWSDSGSNDSGDNTDGEGSESYEVDDEEGSLSEEEEAGKDRGIAKETRRQDDEEEDDAEEEVEDESEEHESDVDVEDDEEESLGEKVRTSEEKAIGGEGAPIGGLESVTLDDYDDMDGLLDILDKYIKRNRFSRALSGVSVPGLDDIAVQSKRSEWLEGSVESVGSERSSADVSGSSKGKGSEQERENEFETKQAKARAIMEKLNEANVKKITTRIYIEDARSFKTLLLTSLMSADQIIADVVSRFHLDVSQDWTLFELCNDHGVERPLRDWEIVTDVISAWDATTSINAIVMKKYAYRDTLSPRSLAGRYPRVQGWMYMEIKPGKWNRRFFVLRDSSIYYYKDANNGSSETFFCSLANYDVYTLSQRRKKSPTQFCFALRSTNSVTFFENKDDYVRFLCVEKQERLYDWVLALRLAKSEKTFEDFPEMFEDYDVSSKARRRREIKPRTALSPVRGRQDVDEPKGRRALSPGAPEPLLKFAPSELGQSRPVRRPMVQKPAVEADDAMLSPTEREGLRRSNTRPHRRLLDDDVLSPSNSEREDPGGKRRVRKLLSVEEPNASHSESDVPRQSRSRRGIETPEEMQSPSEREGEGYFHVRRRPGDPVTSPKPLLSFNDRPNYRETPSAEARDREKERERRKRREEREREAVPAEGGGEGSSSRSGGDRRREDPDRHRRRSERDRDRNVDAAGTQGLEHKAGGSSGAGTKSAGPKPLIDISDSMNCRRCGCSEYRGKGRGDERCTN
ncbi:hypothetical protein HK097_011084, partial [Rhizophlyctis rosea]